MARSALKKRPDRAQREARLLTIVTDHEPSIATKPFPDAQHAGAAFAWGGERYFGIATAVAPGTPYDESIGELRRFGQALAKLHSVRAFGDAGVDRAEQVDHSRSDHHEGSLVDQISPVTATAADCVDRGRPTDSGRRSICHGDAWPGNGRFGAHAVTLFDFEHASIGDPVRDFANVAWWLTGLQQPSDTIAKLWTAFLEGYDEGHDPLRPDLSSLSYHVLLVELRRCTFSATSSGSPEVERSIKAGTQQLVSIWRDRMVPKNGLMSNGW
ncbi:aminoglycoside phosphotransferase family protein [Sinorhizobium meliloti]|uniref:aminoglycoside phosphotransferase family protein n=1 Tax=Rhizobium meliloti TaxID=382 RepID=UPI000FDAEBAA|nr:aminoglycoside phosphotransferase family protein [Sinorhizobium meliloti]RVH43841.1 aminoglycoside phosphotransferase family protein [Sinorhizobium meliloti]